MTHSLSSSATHSGGSGSPTILESGGTTPLDTSVISQTILKFAAPPQTALRSASAISPYSAVLPRMQKLVDTLIQLRQPDSGWSSDRPPTPEALLPYVSEEAQDVLETLYTLHREKFTSGSSAIPAPDGASPLTATPGHDATEWPTFLSQYIWLKNLTPWLLWGIARSAHRVMRLMEGVSARVLQANQDWQPGVLRLVASLEVSVPEASCSLDLATYQTSLTPLAGDRLIQLDDDLLGQEPQVAADLVRRFTEQAKITTPAMSAFLAGLPAEILVPGQDWQSSLVQLHLNFEFIPTDTLAVHPEVGLPFLRLVNSLPIVQFTNSSWLAHYEATVAHQQLSSFLRHLPSLQAFQEPIASVEPHLIALVTDACAIADQLQTFLALPSRSGLKTALGVEELALRLLWSLGYSAYEVMQLMSGIQVNLLQPKGRWVRGMLRFLVSLKVQIADSDWLLDVMTGQWLTASITSPAPDAIVRSDESQWCQQPTLIADLETQVWQPINQLTPEIRLLMAGTEIDLCVERSPSADPIWQPGILQLSAAFEFTPDRLGTEI